MNARRVAWLLVAAVAVIAFAIWLSSLRHLERATLTGDPVLPGLEHGVNTVTEVRLRRADDTHATLKKEASEWMVAERGWPAELGKVREYSAQLERDKTKLIRGRDDLLAFIKGVGRQMSEVVKSFGGL